VSVMAAWQTWMRSLGGVSESAWRRNDLNTVPGPWEAELIINSFTSLDRLVQYCAEEQNVSNRVKVFSVT
jgi:hypothetical protein